MASKGFTLYLLFLFHLARNFHFFFICKMIKLKKRFMLDNCKYTLMKSKRLLMLPLAALLLVIGCRKDDGPAPVAVVKGTDSYSGEKVRNYFDLLCTLSKSTPGFFPPQAARAYGYVGVVNYEAVVSGIDGAQSLGGQLNGLNESDLPKIMQGQTYNWAIASNAAIADMIRQMFGENMTAVNGHSVDSMEQANLAELSGSEDASVINRSVQYGKAVSAAIYHYSTTDGGDRSYVDPFQLPFTLPTDSFCWVPTGPALHPISPLWGNNRPFLTMDVANTQPTAPVAFSTIPGSAFYNQAMSVYNQVRNNGFEQVEITKYWADDPFNTCTPTGHTFNILTQLLQESRATLAKTAVAYARLSIAENDAFISCWKGKYQYVLIRPVSYIQRYIDPAFTTVIGTPAFPAYTSGHSCEMGAGSRVFIDMFTDGSGNYQFTDYSQLRYGFEPRNYSNFNTMAEECADSRYFGGIHYPMDNSKGLQVGRAIGDNVNHLINWPANVH